MTLREQVFRKMGWVTGEHKIYGKGWKTPCDTPKGTMLFSMKLSPIDSQWEVCAKYLVPFMRGRGYEYAIYCWRKGPDGGKSFTWTNTKDGEPVSQIEMKSDNIAEAACAAFMEVELDG